MVKTGDTLLFLGGHAVPGILKDPFSVRCITAVHMHIYTGVGRFSKSCSATVEFENGRTKGEQAFKCETFEQLLAEIQAFTNTL